jgi:hypothetical protein
MSNFTFNVIAHGKTLVLTSHSLDIGTNVWKYQVYAHETRIYRDRTSYYNVLCEGLNTGTHIAEISRQNRPVIGFIQGDSLLIRSGKYTLTLTVESTVDIGNCEVDILNVWLPAIITAYVDERWRRGVNKADADMLTDLQLSVKPGTTVNILEERYSGKPKTEPKAEPKAEPVHKSGFIRQTNADAWVTRTPVIPVITVKNDVNSVIEMEPTVVLYNHVYSIKSIEDRDHDLGETWQFSVIPFTSYPKHQTTIVWSKGIIESHDSRKELSILENDVLRVEFGKLELMINCKSKQNISNVRKFIRHSLLALICALHFNEIERNLNMSGDRREKLNKIKVHAQEARRERNRYVTAKALYAKGDKSATTPATDVKFLCGMAKKSNVLGISTVKFGCVMRKKCVLDIVIPDHDVSKMTADKFGMTRVIRSCVNHGKCELAKADVTFLVANGKVQVQLNISLSEYFITYNGEYVYSYPTSVEFESFKST